MDLILSNARIAGDEQEPPADIGVEAGRIAAIARHLAAQGAEIDLQGRLVSPGFIETHIHLDKSCLLDRCKSEEGTLEEAIDEVATAKKAFQPEEVRGRAVRTLEKSILQGTTHMRSHLEVDPAVGQADRARRLWRPGRQVGRSRGPGWHGPGIGGGGAVASPLWLQGRAHDLRARAGPASLAPVSGAPLG